MIDLGKINEAENILLDSIICVQPIRIQSSAVPTEFPRISWKKWC